MNFFFVMLGGALGAGTRYLSGFLLKKYFVHSFLIGTLLINILGSFLLAFLLQKHNLNTELKLMLATGFMGAFTTYSTFSYELFNFAKISVYQAILYGFLMLSLSLIATILGFYFGNLIFN